MPKFFVEGVNLVIDETGLVVKSEGEIPLFKSKKFEVALQKWLHSHIKEMNKQIQQRLVEIEENIWKQIPFETPTAGGGYYLYSLVDELKLTDTYLEIPLQSELYGTDHDDFE